jgi:hypothetical protein
MGDVDRILEERTEEPIRRMLNRAMASESLTTAVKYKLVGESSEAIKATRSNLFKAGIALRESTDESLKTLKTSIDDFRKSNERNSGALIFLTKALVFITAVQAATLVFTTLKMIFKF